MIKPRETPVDVYRPMDVYRTHVEKMAALADGGPILNRSPEHASVIIEWVFNTSSTIVEILTAKLDPDVYGKEGLVAAALEFLARNNSRIEILSETVIDRGSHPLLSALDTAGFSDRVRLNLVPADKLKSYAFNFAVGDSKNFRFEQSRDSFEAVAHFGRDNVGKKLHEIFLDLNPSSS
jgi:hypothetical protein